jgi:hypothetical protein
MFRPSRFPRCNRGPVSRSPYLWRDLALAFLLVRPWGCGGCGYRFWTPRWLGRLLQDW